MTDGLTTSQSVIGALVIALVLAVLHLLAPRIRRLPGVPETATGSFAGGLAVAYVFLHLLPEIAEGNEAIGEVLGEVPSGRRSSFGWFVVGLVLYAGLLALVTAVSE